MWATHFPFNIGYINLSTCTPGNELIPEGSADVRGLGEARGSCAVEALLACAQKETILVV